jgi:hypothetical protein
VNQLPNDQRQSAIGEGIARLADLIRQSKPDRIVSVKATIGASVVEAARLSGFAGDVVELPFPVRQWRSVFVESLAAALGSQPSVRSSRDKTLRTQPVTAKDIGRGHIRLPITGRAKSLLPKTKTKLRLSLFGRQVDATYDPHFDPDQERSGVIRVGRAALRDVVRPDDTLELSVDDSGTVHLD